jgi:hypothetical protein
MKLIVLVIGCFVASFGQVFADQPELKQVKARTLELQVPSTWVQKEPSSSMRAAEFSIPVGDQSADLVVFYFGGPTGGVKANVNRWIGQFQSEGLQLQMHQGKCAAGRYILVDTKGTWNKPDGPPFARKTIATPDSRVLNVIVIEQKDGAEDYYFLKLSGQQEVVGKLTDALRTAIGADRGSEKEFKLDDAS